MVTHDILYQYRVRYQKDEGQEGEKMKKTRVRGEKKDEGQGKQLSH
jgi:hypothetical protein